MKNYLLLIALCGGLLTTSGCRHSKHPWDEAKSASSIHKKNGLPWGDGVAEGELAGPLEEEFIPLEEKDLREQFADGAIPQSNVIPGEGGAPSLAQFRTPHGELAELFQTLYFNTDDHILRGEKNLALVKKIATYLKTNPETMISIGGHCDERGPEAYNMSLGARRANYVRTLLVESGVDLNKIFTVSHGKERPVALGSTPEAWAKNRRAEFKVYEK